MSSLASQDFKKVIYKAHDFLVTQRDPYSAIEYLNNYIDSIKKPDIAIYYWLALCYLESEQYENAKKTYLSLNAFYQAGYCELLKGNLADAKLLWKESVESEVQYWSKCLETMLEGYIVHVPTFLNLRNHLEADLGYLLKAKQETFANKILALADDLIQVNLEVYKYLGRALLNNGYQNMSVTYLLKGRSILPNDPEIYYHLGQYSMIVGALPEAKAMFKQCLLYSPSYSPAADRLKEIARIK